MHRHRLAVAAVLALLLVPALAAAAEVAAPGLGARVKEWAVAGALALILPAALLAAAKALKAYVAKEVVGLFHKLLDQGDEDDDRLTLAVVAWLDKKAAKLGAAGSARFLVVAADICARIKLLKGQDARVAGVLESIVEGAREGAQKIQAEQPAPEQPTAEPPAGPPPAA